MVPFGNFGWNLGFGFGWILIIVSFLFLVAGVVYLVGATQRPRYIGTIDSSSDRKSDMPEQESNQCPPTCVCPPCPPAETDKKAA